MYSLFFLKLSFFLLFSMTFINSEIYRNKNHGGDAQKKHIFLCIMHNVT